MRRIADFVVTEKLIHRLLTSEGKITNLPKEEDGAKILHMFFDEKNMALRIRVEHDSLLPTFEGCPILAVEPVTE